MAKLSKEMAMKLKRIKKKMLKDPFYDQKVIGYDPKFEDDTSQFMSNDQMEKVAILEKLLKLV